jgi:hypothetical protein
MKGFTVPAGGGRGLLVRPGHDGDVVQLAIVSTRGNVMEAVTLDRGQMPALLGALRRSQEQADRDLMGALSRNKREAKRRHREALERNPWLNGAKNVLPEETYIERDGP